MDQTSQPNPTPSEPAPETNHESAKQALPSGQINSTDKLLACLSYFPVFLIIIFLFTHFQNKKNDPFVVHHMNQGIGVLILSLIGSLVSYMPVVAFLAVFINIIALIFMIVGIINAAQGSWKKLPLVGEFKVFN